MTYTVVWKPAAENELAKLWISAINRQRIKLAADTIDDLLKSDPSNRGESRPGSTRVLFVPPLGVNFKISEADRMVTVMRIWSFSHESN